MTTARIEKAKQALVEHGFAALAVNAGSTLTYLTGLHFHLMERPVVLVIAPDAEPVLVLPELETAKLSGLPFALHSFGYGEDPERWGAVFKDAFSRLSLKKGKIAVEPTQLRLLEYKHLQASCPQMELVDGSPVMASLRARKDETEIAAMRRAVAIAEQALTATISKIAVGVSELDIAGELFLQLIQNGSENTLPFSPIVAGGPNSANPHAQPSARKLVSGDLLVIDWGASWQGYASDLTRTFGIGEIGAEERTMYQLVRAANRAGREAAAPGIRCGAIDDAARAVIDAGGYGQYFNHRTGHGLGMQCHEEPYIRSDNSELLQPGMTFTVEPGIYLSGKNGVRIEDDVLITANGAESLSSMSRELRLIS